MQKISRRGGKNTQNYIKKDLNDPENHSGVITYLAPDILECEVKWALGSIITNKASEGIHKSDVKYDIKNINNEGRIIQIQDC